MRDVALALSAANSHIAEAIASSKAVVSLMHKVYQHRFPHETISPVQCMSMEMYSGAAVRFLLPSPSDAWYGAAILPPHNADMTQGEADLYLSSAIKRRNAGANHSTPRVSQVRLGRFRCLDDAVSVDAVRSWPNSQHVAIQDYFPPKAPTKHSHGSIRPAL